MPNHRTRRLAVALPITLAAACVHAAALAGPVEVEQAVGRDYDGHLAALFETLHRNPELSFLEVQTAARMATELRAAGLEVTEGVGGTGVVGVLRNGDGPLILLRADMDALPLRELSGLPYASRVVQTGRDGQEQPVMHACGHDAHMTSLVGTARQLAALRGEWRGTLMFVAQPAEETGGGALAMLQDGLFDRFGRPDYALAYHAAAGMPTGTIAASEGIQASSADSVDIEVPGIGTHGASPDQGRDPVYIAAQIVVALQGIDSREVAPLAPVVVTVGSFHAGSKHNIIPDSAHLQLTVRANDEGVRAQALAAIERIAINTGRALGLPEDRLPQVTRSEGTPVTANDPALARRLNTALGAALGQNAVVPFAQTNMAAEDFSQFVSATTGVPGYYFNVGATAPADIAAAANGGPRVAGHHSPLFRIAPRDTITLGTRAMVAAVLELAPAS